MANEIATAFVAHYCSTFTSNRPAMASLYQAESTLTWEGDLPRQGATIMEKLNSLPQGTQFHAQTTDVQPSMTPNAMCIFVTGQILIGGETNAIKYAHFIQLAINGTGQHYIHNEIFRLNYA